ncbi:MAG: hypothetical protein EOP83_15475 [Verrucomicrobiaceae bacterium]|nr:MAG: hypothetical protein EOP83_15475 [Verrucomicrobiaceae bacterium]
MVTTITFETAPARSSLALIEAAVSHPLHQESITNVTSSGAIQHTIIFGKNGIEFAKFTFLRKVRSQFVLHSVTGNLPALLWGHHGRLIQSQKQFELGLTLVRWLGSNLVKTRDSDLLLPHISQTNTGHIVELGLAARVADLWGDIFNAGRFSTVNGSDIFPVLETNCTVLTGASATWHINSVRQAGHQFASWTHLECCIRDSELLAKAIRVKHTCLYQLAAAPLVDLFALIKRAAKETLGGALADPPPYYNDEPAEEVEVRRARYLQPPERLHEAIQLEQQGMPTPKADKLRRQFFRNISRDFRACLIDALEKESLNEDRFQTFAPSVEHMHARQLEVMGAPKTPDEAVAETFGGSLLLWRSDPSQRLFFNLGFGLP